MGTEITKIAQRVQINNHKNVRTLSEIVPGSVNPCAGYRPSGLLADINPDSPQDRIYRFIDAQINNSGRLEGHDTWQAIVVRNDSERHVQNLGTLPQTTIDGPSRGSIPRGAVRVWISELHTHLPNPLYLPSWDDAPSNGDFMGAEHRASLAITELYPRCYGPYEFLKDIPVGTTIEVAFHSNDGFEEGVVVLAQQPSEILAPGQEAIPSARRAASNPRDWGSRPADASPIVSLNGLEKKTLALPPPAVRPSPRKGGNPPDVEGFYHTSVDKELIKGPSPYGPVDWTGCGGRGTCAEAPGTPASGKKKYYLKESSELLIEVPLEYIRPYGKDNKKTRTLVHQALLGPLAAMINQARLDGIPYPIFTVYSGYRSLALQRERFKFWLNGKYKGNYAECRKYNSDPDDKRTQPPGGDHYCGRGVDLFLGIDQNKWSDAYQRRYDATRGKANRAFKRYMSKQNVFKWLAQNAEFYGFYNYLSEPWHWAFNPDDRTGRVDSPLEI